MDLGATVLALATGFVVKIAVMVLAARLMVKLYKPALGRPPRKLWHLVPDSELPGMKVLAWSLILFCVSELTCGIEVYILFQSSRFVSALHTLSTTAAMGLFFLGLYDYFDRTAFRFGKVGCLLDRVCGVCTVNQPEGCRFRVVLLYVATFVVLAAVPAFFASTERLYADMNRYILPFDSLNHWHDTVVVPWLTENFEFYEPSGVAFYFHEDVRFLEYRILPLIIMVVGLIGVFFLVKHDLDRGLRMVLFASGMLAFVYSELVLYSVTGDMLIGSLGHEVAEFLFLVATAELLVRCVPRNSGLDPRTPGET